MRCKRTTGMLFATAVLLACGDPAGPIEELSNRTDNFTFKLQEVSGFSSDRSFTWRNTGTTATVTQSSSIGAGTSTLVITDANGTEVYSRSLSQDGEFVTSVGATGEWSIDLDNEGVSGTVSFRVKKGG